MVCVDWLIHLKRQTIWLLMMIYPNTYETNHQESFYSIKYLCVSFTLQIYILFVKVNTQYDSYVRKTVSIFECSGVDLETIDVL